ncbi:proline--tRNA ligase [Candidatus Woesearchaeota archaeon CG_4_10_14_0_2_um_filter_33_10]|nr:MAG: proline--tRNA ligase [Candidatus Woesearchaeota archaeon CG1_02_33_12]PIN78715.1 MAG: proline--tRNA ligase [Candidatus Woesearchaeota archaeon CG10_big_fil_rev_8_21_14_0_10_33_12]PIZ52595.1 MAG: proline--tRNA ligase [Candidatus Woesearchaeota archaeon CG_4_10_14_0_2_um_filter_33_10]
MAEKKETLGLNVKKSDNLSEWYTQVVQKAELADYSSVSGCMVLRPNSYAIWENIQKVFDGMIKKTGHKNAYFPMFIPEHLLMKEKEHVEGFAPEVAWVTHGGNTKMKERLAIRPSSETIISESYANWVRSWRDLPLLINQWCNIVRWEFKYPRPFLRTREFLWQEGHTLHATEQGADKEVMDILYMYKDLMENYLAIPVLTGKKTEKEKFAGAVYTMALEAFMPDGKALQMGTSHMLGQNFAKAFKIRFLGKDEKYHTPWQTSWGITTRLIGAIIMVHGDDKGLIIPPKIAPIHAVIIPILFDKSKEKILKKAEEIKNKLKEYNIEIDKRDEYSPGWKFHEWELKGIPLRIELGPKDLEKNQVVLVRRDTGEKEFVKTAELNKKVRQTLDEIQKDLFTKAKNFLNKNIVEVDNWNDFLKAIKAKKIPKAFFCGEKECEESIKFESDGATSRCIKSDKESGKCVKCGKKAKYKVYFSKSY